MNFKPLSNILSVSPQLSVSDINEVAALGFKSIICSRPDNEETDQPSYRDLEIEAKKNDLEFYYLPVTADAISREDIMRFHEILNNTPSPILGYCRTGNRVSMLWALLQHANTLPIPEVLAIAENANYKLDSMTGRSSAH